jgi:hypothetical protein
MKDWWLIGKISRTFLFTYIFYIYDVVSSYIEALDILKDHCKTVSYYLFIYLFIYVKNTKINIFSLISQNN